jgi:hypothetical protein
VIEDEKIKDLVENCKDLISYGCLLIINNGKGVDVEKYCNLLKIEEEVLIEAGTRFEVTSKKEIDFADITEEKPYRFEIVLKQVWQNDKKYLKHL